MPGREDSLALVDGGVVAIDPGMYALAEANDTLVQNDDLIMIVSLGCGQSATPAYPYRKAKRWGLAQWAFP